MTMPVGKLKVKAKGKAKRTTLRSSSRVCLEPDRNLAPRVALLFSMRAQDTSCSVKPATQVRYLFRPNVQVFMDAVAAACKHAVASTETPTWINEFAMHLCLVSLALTTCDQYSVVLAPLDVDDVLRLLL